MAGRVVAERAQEVDLAEGRPEHVTEVVLGVRRLPQHESGQPLFAAGADDQIGVGLVAGVEVAPDHLGVDGVGELLQRGALVGRVEQQRAHRVGDLLASAVADGDVDEYSVDVLGGVLGLFEGGLHLLRQQITGADVVDAPAAVGGEGADDVLDDAEQRDEFVLRPLEVVGRQQPERDDLHVRLGAPAEKLLDLLGPGPVSVHGGGAGRLRPAAVAVHDDADVLGHLSVVQVAFHPARVQPDQQAAQLVAQVHVIVSPSVRIGRPSPRQVCRGRSQPGGGPRALPGGGPPGPKPTPVRRRGRARLCTEAVGGGPEAVGGTPDTKENGPVRGGETDRPEGGFPP